MLPADERLEPDDPVRRRGRRSAGSGRAARRARARDGGRSRGRSARASGALIDGSNSACRLRRVALGPDHRDLGLAQQLVGRRPARLGRCAIPIDALMNHSRPPERERRAQLARRCRSAIRRGLVGVGDRVEDDPELVAAEPGDRVARAQAADEPLADGHQQPVADGVADALVDDLEPVEVEQDRPRSTRRRPVVTRPGRGRSGRSGARGWAGRWSGRTGRRAGRRRPAARCRGRSRPAGRSASGRRSRARPNGRSAAPDARPRRRRPGRPRSAARRRPPRACPAGTTPSGPPRRRSRRRPAGWPVRYDLARRAPRRSACGCPT